MTDINTDALAEAYTKITDIATKVFHDIDAEQDTYEFLKSIATQINVYRVAVFKNLKEKETKTISLDEVRKSRNKSE